jgi:hypothetical protein
MRMNELQQSQEAAGWFATLLAAISSWVTPLAPYFWKFVPAPLGAVVMIAVDMPKTRSELFWRLVVSFVFSVMLGEAVFDFLDSFALLAFLDSAKRSHVAAVDFLVGGSGWFVLGAGAMWLRKLRADPMAAIADAKTIAKP